MHHASRLPSQLVHYARCCHHSWSPGKYSWSPGKYPARLFTGLRKGQDIKSNEKKEAKTRGATAHKYLSIQQLRSLRLSTSGHVLYLQGITLSKAGYIQEQGEAFHLLIESAGRLFNSPTPSLNLSLFIAPLIFHDLLPLSHLGLADKASELSRMLTWKANRCQHVRRDDLSLNNSARTL